MKVIITGSTGMVGRGVLYECIDDLKISSILLLNRKPIEVKHAKIKEVIVKDLFDAEKIRTELAGYDACFYCLGITSVGAKEDEYTKIMYDMTVVFARELLALNPEMVFCFVSGAGTDGTEKSKTMWARVKGKAENAILNMGFKRAYAIRPGFIRPERGIRSRTGLYNTLYMLFLPLVLIIARFPKYATTTSIMGRAMINVARDGYPKTVLESIDINIAGKGK